MKIAPSVLTANFLKLEEEIKTISHADYIHIDIMDGNFVPNISFGPAICKQISNISKINLDVHLMVLDPLKWIDQFSFTNVEYITVHYEAYNFTRAMNKIRLNGKKIGLSIKPSTKIKEIEEFLHNVDLVLVMSVEPGFGGQKFMENSLKKVEKLVELRKKHNYNFLIEIDGGINDKTAVSAKNAGVDIAVIGSYLFNLKERNDEILKLR